MLNYLHMKIDIAMHSRSGGAFLDIRYFNQKCIKFWGEYSTAWRIDIFVSIIVCRLYWLTWGKAFGYENFIML